MRTLEETQGTRARAQYHLEYYYAELNRQEGIVKAFTAIRATACQPEQMKTAESKIRSAELYIKQLRESYIPQTREAIEELERDIKSAEHAQKGATQC